jgi:hypothetical protein
MKGPVPPPAPHILLPGDSPRPPRVYVGIDPGGTGGGLAAITNNGSVGAVPMPKTEADLWAWFAEIAEWGRQGAGVFAVIEQVHSMPAQGVASTFAFGANYGALRLAAQAAFGSGAWATVVPQTWQTYMGFRKREKGEKDAAWKGYLKGHAAAWFPTVKVVNATADALLIAEYARRVGEGMV